MKKIITLLAALFVLGAVNAQTDLIISEYGEGWGSNKFIELFNPTSSAINTEGYKIKRYSNGQTSASSDYTITLPSFVIEPYKVCVLTQDKRESAGTVGEDESPIWSQLEARADVFIPSSYGTGAGTKCMHWNGNDAVTLETPAGVVIDIFGAIGQDPAEATIPGSTTKIKAWTDTPPYFTGTGLGLSADHTLVRKSSIDMGVTSSPSMFNILAEYDTFPSNTFYNLGWHAFDKAPANTAPVIDVDAFYTVSPSATDGDAVMTVGYTDEDRDQNMEFYIEGGNYIYVNEGADTLRHEPFAINKNSGVLTVADADALSKSVGDTVYVEMFVCDEYAQSQAAIFEVIITDEASTPEINMINTNIVPNPADNYFEIKSSAVISRVEVLSLAGQVIYDLSSNSSQIRVDVDLSAGSYLVRTTYADRRMDVDKLIIK